MAAPQHVTELAALDKILKEAGSKLVIIDFTATWCGPCKKIGPIFEEFSKTYTNVVFLKVDVDQAEEITQSYEVNSMPTFVFIKNGKKIDTFSGADEKKLEATIKKHQG